MEHAKLPLGPSTRARLFRVLVIGGAMLGTGCFEEEPPRADASAPADAGQLARTDAAVEADAGAPPAADGGAIECGLCPNEACCVTDETGSHERPGMVCCWGTSC